MHKGKCKEMIGGTYLGVVARDPVLAPITFPDWRNKGMEHSRKRCWLKLRLSIGTVDQLRKFWREFQLELTKRSGTNLLTNGQSQRTSLLRTDYNYEKSIGCTKMGLGHLRTLCSDRYIYIKQACNLLAEEGLTPEDGNIEANEIVFVIVMGPEYSSQGGNDNSSDASQSTNEL
ncbi:hypothetical protein IEQ34_003230 [Dendrobium chrysotoxum]|uniref:Uncharacterized protein n=1 Tax=Dendrobium chrysotoxum TaxID=161865 RepID=A0AAV7HK17_DENCH|nr:hypothetical protein IEQ34_003230 [Dendrobium chrysotoxum]